MLLACMATLKDVKTSSTMRMRLNQVVECEEILKQWHQEYTASQAVRKSWLSSVCEQSVSESRLAASLGGEAGQVPKRRRVKRKIFGATMALGLGAGAAVAATGTAPLLVSLFSKTAATASVAMMI